MRRFIFSLGLAGLLTACGDPRSIPVLMDDGEYHNLLCERTVSSDDGSSVAYGLSWFGEDVGGRMIFYTQIGDTKTLQYFGDVEGKPFPFKVASFAAAESAVQACDGIYWALDHAYD